jgi:hypothetical protein
MVAPAATVGPLGGPQNAAAAEREFLQQEFPGPFFNDNRFPQSV